MSMKSISAAVLALALFVPGFAQASETSARVYGKQQALSQQNVKLGEVIYVQDVRIQDQSYRLNTGSAVGASTGYLLSKNRSGTERTIAGLAGGAIGTAVQRQATKRKAVEIYIRLEGKSDIFSVVQDADQVIRPGDHVFVSGRGNQMRVTPLR